MIVCIAEKPSVAREIARILGANHLKMGLLRAMGIVLRGHLGIFAP